MKIATLALVLIATLGSAAPASAWDGHHGHGGWRHGHHDYYRPGVGLYIGAPLLWPAFDYYYRPPYATTQVVVERAPEVVYVQREVPAAQAAPANYWYYCPDSKSYYPYVQTCPSGWLTVVPQTSPRGPQ